MLKTPMLFEAHTDLERLLLSRLNSLKARWREIGAERQRLEHEAEQLAQDISALNTALEVEARLSGHPLPQTSARDISKLLGLGLRDAIAALRHDSPGITKDGVRDILKEIGYDFKGKKPGNAVNMAWVILDVKAKKQNSNGVEGDAHTPLLSS